MDLTTTLVLMALLGGLFAYGSWRSSKPADPLKPRMIPWRPIMIASGFATIIMLVHLVNLLGFETGQSRPY